MKINIMPDEPLVLPTPLREPPRHAASQDVQGAIVWCAYPYADTAPAEPGPKIRPVLVLDASEVQATVLYMTSSMMAQIKTSLRYQFYVRGGGECRLKHDGIIDVRQEASLPLTEAYFPRGLRPITSLSKQDFNEVLQKHGNVKPEERSVNEQPINAI